MSPRKFSSCLLAAILLLSGAAQSALSIGAYSGVNYAAIDATLEY